MTTQLSTDEMALEMPLDRSKDREVTVTFKVSQEAIARLVPPHATLRQFEEAFTTLLACGLYTRIQDLRDVARGDVVHQKREAQIALTNLETALLWAEKAVATLR